MDENGKFLSNLITEFNECYHRQNSKLFYNKDAFKIFNMKLIILFLKNSSTSFGQSSFASAQQYSGLGSAYNFNQTAAFSSSQFNAPQLSHLYHCFLVRNDFKSTLTDGMIFSQGNLVRSLNLS
ncbi:hypothetical protein BpHYR1_028618 [Brachionus plicatilis]|uniref:Uncharacterized protein n=1 Tax=Brachionus plicatilis TaxID=10195 RepID=A0A3M7P415_BRAPC|nr:hypothetical protein BpHYR1_028618 [Brachionus plicatilis]